jgi:hypothetical protein
MEKLKLDLERVSVESFELPGGPERARGTVQANSANTRLNCSALTCFVSCAVQSCTHLCC